MRIACPSCAMTYEVPDSRLRPGRVVRCARCNCEWAPVRLENPDASPSATEDEAHEGAPPAAPSRADAATSISAMDILAAPGKPEDDGRSLRTAWIASIVVLIALLVAALIWREEVMTAWPASQRLYGIVGLHAQVAPTHGSGVRGG